MHAYHSALAFKCCKALQDDYKGCHIMLLGYPNLYLPEEVGHA